MHRLTHHHFLPLGIALLLLSPQAFATPAPCKTDGQITNTNGKVINDNRFTRTGQAQARASLRYAAPPVVAVPPEVLNLQLVPPPHKS